jgi:hypothetical protein
MIIDELFEAPQLCPECGGISFSDLILAEKKDACYYKVKASAKVWPSAYASGRLVQCRKKGASNYGNKSEGVAEGTDQINEYRNRLLQYVKGLLPTWPEYVLKDWLVPNKGDFSNLPDNELKNGIMEKLNSAGLTPNTKWQLVPNMKFTMDMFNPMSKKRLIGRAGGHSDMGLDVPRDKERHATQAALARQQGGIRKEPVILIQTPQGYALLEGWHRTIQHFAMYPDGYTGPAYIAVAQGQQGVAEEQELDEKWSQKYKSSINCANPKGFSQKAHCAGRKKNEDVAEGVMYGAENLNVGDDVIVSGDVNLNGATGVIDSFGQDKRFVVVDLYNHGRHSFHSSDVSANDHDNDEHDDDMAEGEQQKGADYRDPKEVDYDDEYDAMVARVKRLAGLGPMKTVYDPAKRVYRNVPTAVQPPKK